MKEQITLLDLDICRKDLEHNGARGPFTVSVGPEVGAELCRQAGVPFDLDKHGYNRHKVRGYRLHCDKAIPADELQWGYMGDW